jgi:hypothetical protein
MIIEIIGRLFVGVATEVEFVAGDVVVPVV